MSFWGIEVTKSKPVTHRFDNARRKLRVTQASFGAVANISLGCAVLCSVGGKTPITLCKIKVGNIESCPLDIEFNEEDNEVIFTIDHAYTNYDVKVHLTGYYIEKCSTCGNNDKNVTVNENEDRENKDQKPKTGVVKVRTKEVKTFTEYAYPNA